LSASTGPAAKMPPTTSAKAHFIFKVMVFMLGLQVGNAPTVRQLTQKHADRWASCLYASAHLKFASYVR
jgi:hypothetical protein